MKATRAMDDTTIDRIGDTRMWQRITWEGSYFLNHSLAIVNRQICRRLAERGAPLSLIPYENDEFQPGALDRPLQRFMNRPHSAPADIWVRHQWPPNFEVPEEGRWVIMQHWEFGSLPKPWIAPMRDEVDEVWVASRWVRDCFVTSGIPEARVHVIPLGADVTRMRPDVRPMDLPTSKTFRFLFVGGTLPRKGINHLVEAYLQAFSEKDDVSLVIKDMGTKSFYRGHTAHEMIAEKQRIGGAPEIVYLDRMFSEEELPGLYTACQCLVAPYRGEGFGMPIVEAMASGLGVIVTGYGPSLDYCTDENAVLIPARKVPMGSRRAGPWETVGDLWYVEPDVRVLARRMREAYENRTQLEQRGRRARRDIERGFTWEHTVDRVIERCDALMDAPPRRFSSERQSSNEATQVHRPVAKDSPDDPRDVGDTTHLGDPRAASPINVRSMRWAACVFTYSGYSQISRALLPELTRRGARIELRSLAHTDDFISDLKQRPAEAHAWKRLLDERVEDSVNFVFHPAADWAGRGILAGISHHIGGAKAHVGITMFETDRLPRGWAEDCNRLTEVWVPSRFNLETFERAGVERSKLVLFQPGIDGKAFASPLGRYALAQRASFNFLSVFQWSRRKGWDVLIKAYLDAFHATDDVCLYIRAYPAYKKDPPIRDRVVEYVRSLGYDPARSPRIVTIDEFIPERRMPELYAAVDAYVQPTRGEGWGLPFMEAMAAGLPTIATRWSGHLDFMNDDNSFLIDVDELSPVHSEQTEEDPYYGADQLWAEPSASHLSRILRAVFENREAARRRGAIARKDILEKWNVEGMVARFERLYDDVRRRTMNVVSPPWSKETSKWGREWMVEWAGPLKDPCGYADEGRNFVLGLDSKGVPVAASNQKWGKEIAELSHDDAQQLDRVMRRPLLLDRVVVHHTFPTRFYPVPGAALTIGRTMFETDGLPKDWANRCNMMDEVWVPSAFNIETFAGAGVERSKLRKIPGAIDADRFAMLPKPLTLTHGRGFNFLSVFDFTLRKGWDVLLRAFIEEFRADEDVSLYLKVNSSIGYDAIRIEGLVRQLVTDVLRRDVDTTPDINLVLDRYSADDMLALYLASDAYVMPSRGEGWGRPYMEAMACGLPVIGTRASGQLEFMNDQNSWLIDARMMSVPEIALRETPTFAGHKWAEPSVRHLRRLMRQVFEDRAGAKERGARARHDILETYDRRRVAGLIVERLDELMAGRHAAATAS